MDFSSRSHQKELLDRDDVPFDAIRKNMSELNTINALLGGHAVTIAGFRGLLGDKKKISVCEIGCGGGDNLRAIRKYCIKKKIAVSCTGIDINPDCIAAADTHAAFSGIHFIVSDYRNVDFEKERPGIIFSSLFCHHFTDAELETMLHWMRSQATTGFFINDLHRHPVAYHSIRWLTRLFSRSHMVKNDAPLSVLRGFKRKDWLVLLHRAGIAQYIIRWKWAFRWLITVKCGNA